MALTNLIGKTLRYLRANGIVPTIKKVVRRMRGTDWLPAEEDHLYIQLPCEVQPHELWEMPSDCIPYNGKISVVIPAFNGAHELPALLAALRAQTEINDLEIVDALVAAATKVAPPEKILPRKEGMGGEDFAYYLQHKPGAMFNIGIREKDWPHVPGHNGKLVISENALELGPKVFVQYVLDRMEK